MDIDVKNLKYVLIEQTEPSNLQIKISATTSTKSNIFISETYVNSNVFNYTNIQAM